MKMMGIVFPQVEEEEAIRFCFRYYYFNIIVVIAMSLKEVLVVISICRFHEVDLAAEQVEKDLHLYLHCCSLAFIVKMKSYCHKGTQCCCFAVIIAFIIFTMALFRNVRLMEMLPWTQEGQSDAYRLCLIDSVAIVIIVVIIIAVIVLWKRIDLKDELR